MLWCSRHSVHLSSGRAPPGGALRCDVQESGEAPEGQQQEAETDVAAGKTAWPASPPSRSTSAAASAEEDATPAALKHEAPQPAVDRCRGLEDAGDVAETPPDPGTSQTQDVAPSKAAVAAGEATPGTAAERAAAAAEEAAAEAERAAAALENEIAAFHEVCPSCLMSCIEAFIPARASVGQRNHRRTECSGAERWSVPRHSACSVCSVCTQKCTLPLCIPRTGRATGAVVAPLGARCLELCRAQARHLAPQHASGCATSDRAQVFN